MWVAISSLQILINRIREFHQHVLLPGLRLEEKLARMNIKAHNQPSEPKKPQGRRPWEWRKKTKNLNLPEIEVNDQRKSGMVETLLSSGRRRPGETTYGRRRVLEAKMANLEQHRTDAVFVGAFTTNVPYQLSLTRKNDVLSRTHMQDLEFQSKSVRYGSYTSWRIDAEAEYIVNNKDNNCSSFLRTMFSQQLVSRERFEMAMSCAEFQMVKFNNHGNFELWKMRVKDLLAQQGILKAPRPQKLESIKNDDWEELQHLWAEAVSMACYLINKSPRESLGGKVAEEIWTCNAVDFDVKGYKFWDPIAKKVVISMDVVIDEKFMLHHVEEILIWVVTVSKTMSLDDSSFIHLLLYVDDMLITAKNMHDVVGLKALLSQEFDMKNLGVANKILGMEIHRDNGSRKLWLSQQGYVEKVLDRFGMSNKKLVRTPLGNHFRFSLEQVPKIDNKVVDMEKVSYISVVGCLMYAMVCTPDFAHVVSQVCKYMSKPGYVDSYLDDRRSTTGYVFTLRGGPICWKSNFQSILALSITKVEYMAAAEAAKEALWLTGLVNELGIQQAGVQLNCGSQSVIHVTKNHVYHARTKHIDVRFHKIRELIASREILLQNVHTSENTCDMLTKPVTTNKFMLFLDLLNGQDIRQRGDLLGMAHIPVGG
ncbi:hypothetical protein F3Y22_tig00110450pilonHSYRG00548 [Hibiscus syriacus]|uniref:Uncharacterized protein n=1 Tax=Hibiscus syriacus TaxID=106335 RepID=A0A6A3ANS8_HIBSY|nr:hypothetical protein F3Y22_tig00110450pilonHSYRG00548 [Hibiscus syriacus]